MLFYFENYKSRQKSTNYTGEKQYRERMELESLNLLSMSFI